jgi:hypothetical protein
MTISSTFSTYWAGWNLKKFFSETTEPISTKLCWNDPWVVHFQKCVRQFRPLTKMGATAELNLAYDPMGNSHNNLLVWNHLLTRRFLWEFPIGFYVNLSSAVGAILVEGSKCWTHFWKRTIQWLFHQNLVLHWMVLFLKCVRRFGPSTKMAPTAELSLT